MLRHRLLIKLNTDPQVPGVGKNPFAHRYKKEKGTPRKRVSLRISALVPASRNDRSQGFRGKKEKRERGKAGGWRWDSKTAGAHPTSTRTKRAKKKSENHITYRSKTKKVLQGKTAIKPFKNVQLQNGGKEKRKGVALYPNKAGDKKRKSGKKDSPICSKRSDEAPRDLRKEAESQILYMDVEEEGRGVFARSAMVNESCT